MKRYLVAGAAVLALILLGLSLFRTPDPASLHRLPDEATIIPATDSPRPAHAAPKKPVDNDHRPAWKKLADALGIEPEPPRQYASPLPVDSGAAEPLSGDAGAPAQQGGRIAPKPADGPPSDVPPLQPVHQEGSGTAPVKTGTEADDDSDRRPPAVVQISFDPPRISDGETSTLDLNVTDDLSGVESVNGTVSSPSARAILGFSAKRIGDSDLFESIISIPENAEQGTWFVSSVYMKDRAANSASVTFNRNSAPPGARLQVESEVSDNTPPVVEDIRLERASVNSGEKNHIFVKVTDDKSGVATVSGVFESPGKAARIGFSCTEDPPSGTWVGEISIPKNADCGEWKLQQLLVVDKANNRKGYGSSDPLLARAVFYLGSSAGCDSTAPVLDSILINPAVVSGDEGAEIVISAIVRDDGTGVSGANGRIEGPPSSQAGGATPKIYFSLSHDPNSPPDVWTARAAVPRFSAKGVWRVTSLQVIDKSNNFKIYSSGDPALATAVLEVK